MSLEQRIQELETQLAQERRRATDAEYMLSAIEPMLGPKAKEVITSWKEQGVTRIHVDWVKDPMKMDGEEIAQMYLNLNNITETGTPVDLSI